MEAVNGRAVNGLMQKRMLFGAVIVTITLLGSTLHPVFETVFRIERTVRNGAEIIAIKHIGRYQHQITYIVPV
jgi:hypothetical protein